MIPAFAVRNGIEMPSQHPPAQHLPEGVSCGGIRAFREILFKPYRIICRDMANDVYFLVIDKGRRDMQTILQRHLFET